MAGVQGPHQAAHRAERPAGENGHQGHKQLRMPVEREITARLEELARTHRITMNTVAQGVWGILLGRYSGEQYVVFEATVAGRYARVTCIESMIGLFNNTLPVRAQMLY